MKIYRSFAREHLVFHNLFDHIEVAAPTKDARGSQADGFFNGVDAQGTLGYRG